MCACSRVTLIPNPEDLCAVSHTVRGDNVDESKQTSGLSGFKFGDNKMVKTCGTSLICFVNVSTRSCHQ